MGVSSWMNATVGPSEARRAKEDASADSAEERKDTTGVNPWRLHFPSMDLGDLLTCHTLIVEAIKQNMAMR